MEQCLFCNIANGKIPAKKVYEDDKVAAVLDINPGTDGHILVLPKKHVEILLQMDDDLASHVGMICKQLSQALLQAFKCDGTSIFVANGPAAGQRAPHGMVHVMPRTKDDEIVLDLPIVKLDEKVLNELHGKLAVAVAKEFGKEPMIGPKSALEVKKVVKDDNEKGGEAKKEIKTPAKKITEEKKAKSKLDEIAEFSTGGK
jgi:histidine triad (HIT) family protein